MEYFTELLGKEVVSIFEQKVVGTLLNLQIDWTQKRVKNLVIVSADEEAIFLLNPKFVLGVEKCITIRNCASLNISVEPELPQIIGKNAIDLGGKFFGKINEIAIEKWKIQLLYADEQIDTQKLIYVADEFVLINTSTKRVSLHNFKPKTQPVATTAAQTVSILDNASSVEFPKTITAQNTTNSQ